MLEMERPQQGGKDGWSVSQVVPVPAPSPKAALQ